MNISLKSLLLALSLCFASTSNNNANGFAAAFKNDGWGLLEDSFILQPEEAAQSTLKIITQCAVSAGTGIGGYFAFSKGLSALQALAGVAGPGYNLTRTTLVALGTLASTVTGYQALAYYFQSTAEYHALEKFLANWAEYRPYTPHDLVEFFDGLARRQHRRALSSDDIYKAIRIIKTRIYKQFPTRYQRELKNIEEQRLTIWQNVVQFDIAGIIRALTGAYETYDRVNRDNNRR